MRRLLRILLSAATALSVLIGVAAAVLWPRSYSHEDEIQYDRVSVWEARGEKIVSETQAYLSPRAGAVSVYVAREPAHSIWDGPNSGSLRLALVHGSDCSGAVALERFGIMYAPPASRLGFVYDSTPYLLGEWRAYRIPYWALVAAACVLPALQLVAAVRRRRRRRSGRCLVCGYDLRATPERCPECGTVAVAGEGREKS